MERSLWEILVPRTWNDGADIDTDFHRLWDAKVREVSGGLTIRSAEKGQWVFQGKFIEEETIPCRVIATREELDKILAITLAHYHDQYCVMAYKISNEVTLRYRDDDGP
jgi:hypothetical protein